MKYFKQFGQFIFISFLIQFIFSACQSSEESMKSFAESNEPVPFSELKENFDDYEGEKIVIEGTINNNCCGKREVPLIDLQELIYSNGDVVHVALDFNKDDLAVVRSFSTGMPIKIVGIVDYMRTDDDFIREIGAKEYYIHIKDCVVVPRENTQNMEEDQDGESNEVIMVDTTNIPTASENLTINGQETLTNTEVIYYHIQDPDGFSNLRDGENGRIIRKVYPNEIFVVTDSIGSFMKVRFEDESSGFIHKSRVVKN
jgi:hypothetical protein